MTEACVTECVFANMFLCSRVRRYGFVCDDLQHLVIATEPQDTAYGGGQVRSRRGHEVEGVIRLGNCSLTRILLPT